MELDVSKFQLGGVWLKINLEQKNGKKGKKTVSVLVKPLSDRESIGIGQAATKDLREMATEVHKVVIGWDVKFDGKELDCNEENKKKYLPYICKMEVEGEEERVKKLNIEMELKAKEEGVEFTKDFPKDVGAMILDFSQDFNNFIKN